MASPSPDAGSHTKQGSLLKNPSCCIRRSRTAASTHVLPAHMGPATVLPPKRARSLGAQNDSEGGFQRPSSIPAATRSAIRLVCGRPWLLALLGGLAAFFILMVLGWFFLLSPYSGPTEFIYNQF